MEWNGGNNFMDLERVLYKKWNKISMDVVQMFISSMTRRCVAALGVNGGRTRY